VPANAVTAELPSAAEAAASPEAAAAPPGTTRAAAVLERYARDSADLSEAAAQMVAEEGNSGDQLAGAADNTPVVRDVTALIERAITSRGSDIHLEPSEFDLKVRLRIDGVLHAVDTVPQGIQAALISRFKIMSGLDITERRVPQNGRISMVVASRSVDLRVAVEDPVEYRIDGINQVQVNPKSGLDLPRCCRPSCGRTRRSC